MRKIKKFVTTLMIALALTVMFAFAQTVSANDDVSDSIFKNPKEIQLNKVYTQKFENECDEDCYVFYPGGDRYTITVYCQTLEKDPWFDDEVDDGEPTYVIPVNFSEETDSAGGYTYYGALRNVIQHDDGWYEATAKIGTYQNGETVYLTLFNDAGDGDDDVPGFKFKGTYKFKVNGKAMPGGSSGLAKAKIKGLSNGKKSFTVKWNKVRKATGYQVRYSSDKNFRKNVKTVNLKNGSILKKKVKRLKSHKTYYVKVRAFRKSGGGAVYGKWSDVRKVKVK